MCTGKGIDEQPTDKLMNEIKRQSHPLSKWVQPWIIFRTPLGNVLKDNVHRNMQEYSEPLFLCVGGLRQPGSGRFFKARGKPLPVQWLADEPLIVYTGSGNSLTWPPLFFDLYFMRTVKAHQVQQESTSDKSHLLLVTFSVWQTDAISLLTRLYDLHITIAGQV